MASPTGNNDIRDLVGRYATSSLSADEEKRLFEAALDDQELFDELAQEGDVKMLLAEPGARDRILHAASPPKKKWGWWFGGAAVAAATVVMVVFLMRPAPKPVEIAVANQPAAPATAATVPVAEPAKVEAPPPKPISSAAPNVELKKAVAANEVAKDALAAPVPVPVLDQAAAQGGPRQNQQSPARAGTSVGFAAPSAATPFGFHYTTQTKGHLIIIPLADGYLSVKGGDGSVLYAAKSIAAGISEDLALPDSISVVSITFSADPSAVSKQARTTNAVEDNVTGASPVSVEVRIRP